MLFKILSLTSVHRPLYLLSVVSAMLSAVSSSRATKVAGGGGAAACLGDHIDPSVLTTLDALAGVLMPCTCFECVNAGDPAYLAMAADFPIVAVGEPNLLMAADFPTVIAGEPSDE